MPLADPGARPQVVLPPGQHGQVLVLLDPEVDRLGLGGKRLEPDQLPVLVEDHRPVLERTLLRSEEDVPGGRVAGVADDFGRRGREVGLALEARHVAIGCELGREGGVLDRARGLRDGEPVLPCAAPRTFSAVLTVMVSPGWKGLSGRKLAPGPSESACSVPV